MSDVSVKKIQHGVFGNCAEIDNGRLKLIVTLDFGPRIIYCSIPGMQNMFYVDEKRAGLGPLLPEYDGDIHRVYGGHRLWASPEVLPRCYCPDNQSVSFVRNEYGAVFTAPVEKCTYLQKSIGVTMAEDVASVTVEHVIKNCGVWEVELAPWALTMFAAGGREIVPMQNPKTGLLPDRNLTLWDYSNMADKRVYWGREYVTLAQDKGAAESFKFGLDNRSCWVAVFVNGQVLVKSFDYIEDALYPDGGCNFETFTNADFLECESLGPLTLLPPGETASHGETWEVYESAALPDPPDGSKTGSDCINYEKKLAAIINKYNS